ncbi:delta-like protein [Elysia marginata]|uniref:Delta-like protein n=1 Tax=Elysia marginata TaxID=1093978 RepID=A0AAV4HT66_9GAST|nr:delta-like protein [Elysia marginata]
MTDDDDDDDDDDSGSVHPLQDKALRTTSRLFSDFRFSGPPVCDVRCMPSRASCTAPNTCVCRPGWSGEHCDHCKPGTGCIHGTCFFPGQCVCHYGWTGPRCDVKKLFCALHKPCKNGGTCAHLGQYNYTCACAVGYKGRHCEITACHDGFCGRNGICFVSEQTRFCRCVAGYTGPTCQLRLESRKTVNAPLTSSTPPLLSSPLSSKQPLAPCVAMNCTENNLVNNLYKTPNPKDNSSCLGVLCNENTLEEKPEFSSLTTCETLTCYNGGECRQSPDTGVAICACPEPFRGRQCLDKNSASSSPSPCLSNPCRYGNPCFNILRSNEDNGTESFFCKCVEGLSGEMCEEIIVMDTSICASAPCRNGGNCVEYDGEFVCACRRGFRGRLCTKRRKSRRLRKLEVKIETTFYSPSLPPSSSSAATSLLANQFYCETALELYLMQLLLQIVLHTVIPLFIVVVCTF